MPKEKTKKRHPAYRGELTPLQAATAMHAARLNASDLLETAEMLLLLKKFAHSSVFSILAIEEIAKLVILKIIFLGFCNRSDLWKQYREHRGKTKLYNVGIEARIRAVFPEVPRVAAKGIAGAGPTPDELEESKQLALYSDCVVKTSGQVCHLPRSVDWSQLAWHRLNEARALVQGSRDYSPEELEIWLKHAKEAQAKGGSFATMLEPLHKELLERGFVKEGWWDTILADTKRENGPE